MRKHILCNGLKKVWISVHFHPVYIPILFDINIHVACCLHLLFTMCFVHLTRYSKTVTCVTKTELNGSSAEKNMLLNIFGG